MKQVITTSLVFTESDILDLVRQVYDGVPEDAEIRYGSTVSDDGLDNIPEIIVTFTKEDAA